MPHRQALLRAKRLQCRRTQAGSALMAETRPSAGHVKPRCGSRAGFTYVDLCVLILLVILLAAYVILGSGRIHEFPWRIKCGSNLRQIGQAMMLYANENGGHYPRARYDPADAGVRAYTGANAAAPFAADGPQAN